MEKETYEFELRPLPYSYNALEPFIDTLTMQLHHDRHLATYVQNLNDTLKDYPRYHNWTVERLLLGLNFLPRQIMLKVKNNAGGIYNHNFYFDNISNQSNHYPFNELENAINKTFGSYDKFKDDFKTAALNVFGSGYAFLAMDRNKRLKIIQTHNQDTPLSMGMRPILCIDVWEHAYYLKHYNKRANYIEDWFNVVNFDFALKKYLEYKAM